VDERSKYIGGSEAAAVLGMSRWNTPLNVWAIKTGQIMPDPEDKGSEAAMLGKELEDYVARRFTRITGKEVRRVNDTLYHPDFPFLGANIDRRIVGENAVLECKTTSAWKYKEWEGEDIPQEYLIQVLHYMAVGGFEKGYIACLIGNHKFVWKEIVLDKKLIADLIQKEVHFWNAFVIPKVMPVVSSGDTGTLNQLFQNVNQAEPLQLGDDAEKIVESLDSLKADAKVLEKEIEQQENALKALLGEFETGLTFNHKIVWKLQTQRRLSTDLLKQDMPEVYEKYTRPVQFRRLGVYERKEQK
jgi:putative phage-type endonuclease